MTAEHLEASYGQRFIADLYDGVAFAVFAPAGGLGALRRAALDRFGIATGDRVLELGCGSGGVTRLLCARGAQVTAVDWSVPMLNKARRRAPAAAFVRSEITAFEPAAAAFDVVLFCFVLHELDAPARGRAFQVAQHALKSDGRLAVVDHAVPERGVVARAISRAVHGFEPASSQGPWLRPGGAEAELAAAGFLPDQRSVLAAGLAFALAATPAQPGGPGPG